MQALPLPGPARQCLSISLRVPIAAGAQAVTSAELDFMFPPAASLLTAISALVAAETARSWYVLFGSSWACLVLCVSPETGPAHTAGQPLTHERLAGAPGHAHNIQGGRPTHQLHDLRSSQALRGPQGLSPKARAGLPTDPWPTATRQSSRPARTRPRSWQKRCRPCLALRWAQRPTRTHSSPCCRAAHAS